MCLALMGPGDTAMIPAPFFPVHMYGVVLAAGNVVALEVADSDKFRRTSLTPVSIFISQTQTADYQLSAQSIDHHGRTGFLS